MDQTKIKYSFVFPDESQIHYEIMIDRRKRKIINTAPTPPELQQYTDLEFNKCSNCPLSKGEHPECPVAKNLLLIDHQFANKISHDKCFIVCDSPQRAYTAKTDVQVGLQSIFGLVMASSGCPHLDFLSPMAMFHLPFSNEEETIVRILGFYLLEQFINNDGAPPTFDLLKKRYAEINTVNRGVIERIRSVEREDAGANAIVILDTFSMLLSSEMSTDLESVRYIFENMMSKD